MVRLERNTLLVLTVFEISILVIVFDLSLTSPIHEFGHFFACLALGVEVNSIGWNQIIFTSVSDWRQNIIGFSGGLFAAFFLFCLYILSVVGFSHFQPQTKKGILMINYFSLLVKSILLADMMVQLTGAAFEGTDLSIYQLLVKNILVLYVLTLIFSAVSLFAVIRQGKTMKTFPNYNPPRVNTNIK
jgi:uncharacterized membrane protein YozB (DUF420 family)